MSSRWRWGPGWGETGAGRGVGGGEDHLGGSHYYFRETPRKAGRARATYLLSHWLTACWVSFFLVADWPKCQSRSLGKRYSRLDRGEIGPVPEASLYIGVGTSFHPHPGASINRVRKRTGIEIVGADDKKVKVWKSANLTSSPNPSYTQLGT